MNALYTAAMAGRWVARITGALFVLFFLVFQVADGPRPSDLRGVEILQALGLLTLLAGLVVAWMREGLGGLLTVGGYAFMVLLHRSNLRIAPFWIPAGIGVLHVLCRARLRPAAPAPTVYWHVPTPVLIGGGAIVLLFASLSANEMLGMPPWMTPELRSAADLAGRWTGMGNAVFVIQADGSVTGRIGTATLVDARLMRNRSWFGELMNWRTAYLIRGRLSEPLPAGRRGSSDRFTAPLDAAGPRLEGSIFVDRYPFSGWVVLRRGRF